MYTFIDWILFILLALCVGYLLFYAIASKFYRPRKLSEARILRRFLVLFPAYKEDRVIVSTIRNFLEQDYSFLLMPRGQLSADFHLRKLSK